MQAAAEFGEGAAAVGDLFGTLMDGADQAVEEVAQMVQRILDLQQVAGARIQRNRLAEVAPRPVRQQRHQPP
ncbi:hypothetical protein D3C78_1410370 [compost metagenome]